jgi:ATP-dependent 26S proteasome regulatory subunit
MPIIYPDKPEIIKAPAAMKAQSPDNERPVVKKEQAENGAPDFACVEPRWSLEDLVLTEQLRRQLDTAIGRCVNRRKLYEEWGLSRIDRGVTGLALNFFGPPGTGKSICAEAVARALGRRIINVCYSELVSKFVGDTPKNIMAAFAAAADSGAVLLFDEADAILGKRFTNVSQGAEQGVNVERAVMLKKLDSFDGVVIFATNLACNYDQAFVRRIQAHVEFGLPDLPARCELWRRHMPAALPVDFDLTPDWLASNSDGLSGGDIRNAVINAASRAALRPAELQRITRADILAETEAAMTARKAVGS